MIQDQISAFTNTLTSLASEYSNPAIILDHMPVLKDNPQIAMMGGAGVVGLFVLRKLAKRRGKMAKPVAMVMPAPYVDPQADATPEQVRPEPLREPLRETASAPKRRSVAEQLDDVGAISFAPRPAFSADEARMRAVLQAVLSEMGAPYQIMARTSLAALITPTPDAAGTDRANACAAIADKHVDFGIFDRAGRLAIAIEMKEARPIVRQALEQAGIASIALSAADTPAEIRAKIAPYLKVSLRAVPAQSARPEQPAPATARVAAPVRPTRPGRPARPAVAFAAE